MKVNIIQSFITAILLAQLVIPATSYAEIYKWVDANGTTHYSQKKPESSSQAEKMEIEPPTEQSANGYEAYLRNKEAQRKEKVEAELQKPDEAPEEPKIPTSLSNGRVDGTDASKCALAKDIINGAVKRRHSATDETDIATAKSDIKLFCK